MHTVWSGCITKNITAYTLIHENLLASSSFLHILTLNFFLHPLKKAQACNLVGFVHVFVSSLLNIQYSFPMIVKEDFFPPVLTMNKVLEQGSICWQAGVTLWKKGIFNSSNC